MSAAAPRLPFGVVTLRAHPQCLLSPLRKKRSKARMEWSETSECTICLERITEDALCTLPCQCKVHYCMACWDRALAAAFNNSGQARCPTCRGHVRVDFDPDAGDGCGRLVFSAGSADEQASQSAVVNKLAGQAAPLMSRLLRKHGQEHPSLRMIAQDPTAALTTRPTRALRTLLEGLGGTAGGCIEKSDLLERMLARAGGASKLAAYVAAGDAKSLEGETGYSHVRCVCGGRLERVSGRERCQSATRKIFGSGQLGAAESAFLEQFAAQASQSLVVCDLCDKPLSAQTSVYSCGTGESTILHPTTYGTAPCYGHHMHLPVGRGLPWIWQV
jgi:hypothetical protein